MSTAYGLNQQKTKTNKHNMQYFLEDNVGVFSFFFFCE